MPPLSLRCHKSERFHSLGILNLALLGFIHYAGILVGLEGPARAQVMYEEEVEQELAERHYQFIESTRGQSQGVSPPETVTRKTPFSGLASIEFKNQYLPYGVVLDDEGVTMQAFLSLRYSLYDGKPGSVVNNVTIYGTTWNDFSTDLDLSSPTSPYKNFREADLIAGVAATFAERWNANLSFTSLVSPAGGFGEGAYLKGVLTYDDTGLLAKDFAIRPQVSVIYTLPATSFLGLQPNAVMIEPGVTPNYTFKANTKAPFNVALPMRVGLGNAFYAGVTYGFFSVGPQLTLRLPFLSNAYANTNLSLGYTYYHLGETTTDFAPNGQSSQHVVNMGMSVSF